MKKLLAIILMATLLFTGCGKKQAITAEAKEYGYFNFDNLEWGMTSAEVMKKLGKKESDFEIQKGEVFPNQTTEITYVLDNAKFKKKNASISYVFYGITDVIEKQSLRFVHVTLSDTISEEEAKEISALVQSDIQTYEIETTEETKQSYSSATMKCASKAGTSDLPQELQDKANAYARKLANDLKDAGVDVPFEIERYQYTVSTNPALSQVVAEFRDVGDTQKFRISFDGQGMSFTKLYARLAEAEGVK